MQNPHLRREKEIVRKQKKGRRKTWKPREEVRRHTSSSRKNSLAVRV